MNWRYPIINTGLKVKRSKIPENLNKIRTIEDNREKIEELHKEELRELILHCYNNVPYYKDVLEEAKVIQNGEVHLENFSNIPTLTKEDVRENFDDLKAKNISQRDTYENSSGGSTGKPLNFIQDETYKEWNYSNKLYYAEMAGKQIGEPEIKLWGSERDIEKGKETITKRLRNFLYNRTLLNSFKMSEDDMKEYAKKWNNTKPKYVWTYVDSIYEFAKFAKSKDLTLHPPKAIVTTAGTLDEEVRTLVEEVFNTTVINQYGSREVGDMAAECPEQEGLHIFEHTHHLEVIDNNENPIEEKHGDIVVTNLRNYSMPLLRYKIEDTGVMSKKDNCSCGRKWKKLKKVTGRTVNHFETKEGDIIHGEYFTHLFYHKDWVNKFRVIQNDYEKIKVEIEKADSPETYETNPIKEKIRKVMGSECEINFDFKDEIKPSKSGKFLFTESKIR